MMFAFPIQLILSFLALASVCHSAISEALLQKFELYNQYAGASYCAKVNDVWGKPGRNITCKTKTCPLVEKNKATVLVSMTEIIFSSIAVLALDPTEKNLGTRLDLIWSHSLIFPSLYSSCIPRWPEYGSIMGRRSISDGLPGRLSKMQMQFWTVFRLGFISAADRFCNQESEESIPDLPPGRDWLQYRSFICRLCSIRIPYQRHQRDDVQLRTTAIRRRNFRKLYHRAGK